ncbi:MAG: hypothetical protein NC417_09930 [Candidatus Gastranaerophilales bacterium]|nr:hypothetical protein [Candidatus Gastranaerophilales bacterium]
MKKTLFWHARFHTAALCTLLIGSLCLICTGCGKPSNASDTFDTDLTAPDSSITNENIENTADSNMDTDSSDAASDGVDINAFIPMQLRELSVDLSADQVPDTISVFLLGLPGDVLTYAETLVSKQARSVRITITDGATAETLYDRTFSVDHIGEGQLSLVQDQDNFYLLETNCHEQMGYASYTGEVFAWNDGEKVTIDSFETHFITEVDAAFRNVLNGEALTGREEAITVFQDAVEHWSQDCEILTACDCLNGSYRRQDVFISTEEQKYSANDFYSLIWDRPSASYTAEEFDELMGYSGYCIYEMSHYACTVYYFSAEGELIAEAGYTSEDNTFLIDLDQDGSNELISNVMWSDGAQATLIYKKDNNVIMRGYADDLLDVEYDNISYWSEYSYYIPEENVVEIFYWNDADESFYSKKYEIDLERIHFERYAP